MLSTILRVTPHVVRHTTALHLLHAGVDIAVIALWLGHESIETTRGYVEADLEMKQRALEKLTPAMGTVSRFKAGDSLLQFLSKLCFAARRARVVYVLTGRTCRSRPIVVRPHSVHDTNEHGDERSTTARAFHLVVGACR